MPSVHYSKCCKIGLKAESRYAECRYAECRYAECRYAECRGADQTQIEPILFVSHCPRKPWKVITVAVVAISVTKFCLCKCCLNHEPTQVKHDSSYFLIKILINVRYEFY